MFVRCVRHATRRSCGCRRRCASIFGACVGRVPCSRLIRGRDRLRAALIGRRVARWRFSRGRRGLRARIRARRCRSGPQQNRPTCRAERPAVKVGTAVAESTLVAGLSAQMLWQMRLTRRALASDLESTPNEAADVPAAVSRSLTATGSARPAADSPACPASRVPLQPRTTAPSGPRSEKPVSHQPPHARRSALMTR